MNGEIPLSVETPDLAEVATALIADVLMDQFDGTELASLVVERLNECGIEFRRTRLAEETRS